VNQSVSHNWGNVRTFIPSVPPEGNCVTVETEVKLLDVAHSTPFEQLSVIPLLVQLTPGKDARALQLLPVHVKK